MFGSVYAGKKVLVTGHTGFKGSWLTAWLLSLGAEICGISKDIPTSPSLFEGIGLEKKIQHNFEDLRNFAEIKKIILDFRPDFLFHLAAQAIVSLSYKEPLETITTNVIGTANILEVLRSIKHDCYAVIITSDKCYENVEWEWGYRETDKLGGKDVYGGSKAAAEIIFHAYQESFFPEHDGHVKIVCARAGNVIGGGDWAPDRIVTDAMRAWGAGVPVKIRSPVATRPWQHVLEPLSGYLTLGMALTQNSQLHGEQFNFGPKSEQNCTVAQLLEDLSAQWGFESPNMAYQVINSVSFDEANLLKLNCDKALFQLKWQPNLDYEECIKFVSQWYYSYFNKEDDMLALTQLQIKEYQEKAKMKSLIWAQ